MNARMKTIITLGTGLLISMFISCTNPTGLNLAALPTGIDNNADTGLIAGLNLDSDLLLNIDGVSMGGTVEWVPGVNGNAMRSDADGDFIQIADGTLPELTDAGTVSVWIFSEEDNAWAGIIHKGDEKDVMNTDGVWHYIDEAWSLQYTDANSPYFFLQGENRITTLDYDGSISPNQWHNIVVTWDYNSGTDIMNLAMYIDGVEVVSKSESGIGAAVDSDGDMIVGSQLPVSYDNGTWGHMTFRGLIDEVALFNRALSTGEIEAAYDALNPNP